MGKALMEGEHGEMTLIETEELSDIKKALQYYRKQYKEFKVEIARLTLRIHKYEDSEQG